MKNEKKRQGVHFSGEYQPPASSKRVKKRKTILKESIGLQSFEAVQEYILTKGAAKFVEEFGKLEGRNFTQNYLSALEFFKPKLQRTTITDADGKSVPVVQIVIPDNSREGYLKGG